MKEQIKAVLESHSPFVVVTNTFVQDKNISLKAKGLAAHMFSLPSGWNFSIRGLMATTGEGRTVIETALKELISARYLVRTRHQDENGYFHYTYKLFAFPCVENPCAENPHTENLHNNKENNNKENNNIYSKPQRRAKKEFVPPTLAEIEAYVKERNNGVDARKFFDYYSAGNWHDGVGKPIKNWKQKMIANWENKNQQNTQVTHVSFTPRVETSNASIETVETSFFDEFIGDGS